MKRLFGMTRFLSWWVITLLLDWEFSLYVGAGDDPRFESFWLTLAFLGLLWAKSFDGSILMFLIEFGLGSIISLDLG